MPLSRSRLHALVLCAVICCSSWMPVRSDELDALKKRLEDAHAEGTDLWIYNDISTAFAEAKKSGKPIFVTFRCVPCKACEGFDATVAKGNEAIAKLARERFVSVRQVEMKGVDLSFFQFDHDLNWAAMFVNADGAVYARYGTQSAEGPDAYNSVEGLLATMERVLELHAAWPANKEELTGKRAAQKPWKTALEMPGLQNKEKLRGETARNNCIHCHMIHDAENFDLQERGEFERDMLWRYPLPENIGLKIDGKDGRRIAEIREGSPAARAGLKVGESVTHVEGQAITSIADMQWVLHHTPNRDTAVTVRGSRSGDQRVQLTRGWKEIDISWRGSMWSLSPHLRVWAPELSENDRRERGLSTEHSAYLVRWINTDSPGGRAAKDGGLRQGDVIIAVGGKKVNLPPNRFNLHVKLNYAVGDDLPLTVLRGDRRLEVKIRLAE